MTNISDSIKCSKVRKNLIGRIVNGEFPYGSRFPGLHDLEGACHVSYVTICKAVKMLADEGYLCKHPGVGYFVCYADSHAKAEKEVNIISSPGYYQEHQSDFDYGIELFRKNGWKAGLLRGNDIGEFTEQLNSPCAYSILTAFNVNWSQFAATFSHHVKRTIVLGRLSGNPEITSIVCDEHETIRQAMEHFSQMGRRRVALAAVLPQSNLEAMRIAAWRKMALSSGLSMEWTRRHLFSLDLENQSDDPVRMAEVFRQWLSAERKNMDAVIIPGHLPIFLRVCRELGIRIPEDLAVLSIGLLRHLEKGVEYLDHNYREHFDCALEILEDRFKHDHVIPGSWYFCAPRGIITHTERFEKDLEKAESDSLKEAAAAAISENISGADIQGKIKDSGRVFQINKKKAGEKK